MHFSSQRMRFMTIRRHGWYRESYRHALAAKGISTRKIRKYDVVMARNLSEDPSDPDIIYTTEILGEEISQEDKEKKARLEKERLEAELKRINEEKAKLEKEINARNSSSKKIKTIDEEVEEFLRGPKSE